MLYQHGLKYAMLQSTGAKEVGESRGSSKACHTCTFLFVSLSLFLYRSSPFFPSLNICFSHSAFFLLYTLGFTNSCRTRSFYRQLPRLLQSFSTHHTVSLSHILSFILSIILPFSFSISIARSICIYFPSYSFGVELLCHHCEWWKQNFRKRNRET